MHDTLKDYIDQHRGELDKAVPSDELWAKIETSMIVAIPAAGIASKTPWLKYFGFDFRPLPTAQLFCTRQLTPHRRIQQQPLTILFLKKVVVNAQDGYFQQNPAAGMN
jgi:hypothetical protein